MSAPIPEGARKGDGYYTHKQYRYEGNNWASEMPSSQRTQITNMSEVVEKMGSLYIVGGPVNWGSHCGKQCRTFSRN